MPHKAIKKVGRNLSEGAKEATRVVRRRVRRIPSNFVGGLQEVRQGFPNTLLKRKRRIRRKQVPKTIPEENILERTKTIRSLIGKRRSRRL